MLLKIRCFSDDNGRRDAPALRPTFCGDNGVVSVPAVIRERGGIMPLITGVPSEQTMAADNGISIDDNEFRRIYAL